MPPHAEEITFADGKLYLLFESASRRFQYGKLVGGSYVYACPCRKSCRKRCKGNRPVGSCANSENARPDLGAGAAIIP